MLDVPTADAAEPQMRVPQPVGWQGAVERPEHIKAIRFALRVTDSADNRRTSAVVAIEHVPDLGAEEILDHELARQVKFFDEEERASMTTARTTVCGLTAQKTTRRKAKIGMFTSVDVVTKAGGQAYVAGVTVVTPEGNATYLRDAESIVTGFQVLPPSAKQPG